MLADASISTIDTNKLTGINSINSVSISNELIDLYNHSDYYNISVLVPYNRLYKMLQDILKEQIKNMIFNYILYSTIMLIPLCLVLTINIIFMFYFDNYIYSYILLSSVIIIVIIMLCVLTSVLILYKRDRYRIEKTFGLLPFSLNNITNEDIEIYLVYSTYYRDNLKKIFPIENTHDNLGCYDDIIIYKKHFIYAKFYNDKITKIYNIVKIN